MIVATNFADYTPPEPAVMLLADLGVNSPQLDVPEQGFSFRLDGPLDMRMNPEAGGETAADLIDRLEESDLADLIYRYGEERLSEADCPADQSGSEEQGAYEGTAALAYAVAGCYPPKARRGRIHPATAPSRPCGLPSTMSLGCSIGCCSRRRTGWNRVG